MANLISGMFDKNRARSDYIKNMETMARTNLSLLNSLNDMQQEYDTTFAELTTLREEVKKLKGLR